MAAHLDSVFSSELAYLSTVAFGGFAVGGRREIHASPALFCDLESEFTARFCFPIQGPSYGRRAAHFAEKQDLDFKIAPLGPNLQDVTNPNFPCRLDELLIGLNSAEFTGSGSQATRLKKSGSPEPLIHPNTGHELS